MAAVATVSGVWNSPGVDHLHARVAQQSRYDFDAAIVTIEAHFGDEDAHRHSDGTST